MYYLMEGRDDDPDVVWYRCHRKKCPNTFHGFYNVNQENECI